MRKRRRTLIPAQNGEVVGRRRPNDLVLRGPLKLLERHRKLPLLDFVIGEDLELRREAELVGQKDQPLRGIVLIPLDGVAEVLGELVVLWGQGGVSC